MKSNKDALGTIAEKPRNRREQHSRFLSFSTREGRFQKKSTERTIGKSQVSSDYVKLERAREQVLENKVCIRPEYLAVSFNLEGCPRQLLDYIVHHELSPIKNTCRLNEQTISRFTEFCALFGKSYSPGTIRKSIRTLVENNAIQNVSRGVYMVNPLIASCGNYDMRRALINDYSKLLIDKGKDAILDFLPLYPDA